jgi:eukaryotic-like serine/threonine-protein kinase
VLLAGVGTYAANIDADHADYAHFRLHSSGHRIEPFVGCDSPFGCRLRDAHDLCTESLPIDVAQGVDVRSDEARIGSMSGDRAVRAVTEDVEIAIGKRALFLSEIAKRLLAPYSSIVDDGSVEHRTRLIDGAAISIRGSGAARNRNERQNENGSRNPHRTHLLLLQQPYTLLTHQNMQIASGARLAQYEIAAPLGRGGMGAVYRARDMNLGRDVAVKVLPDEFTFDPERMARFEREAHVLASLNHPHIATIYDFAELNGAKFLVMELVDGETLESRMSVGPIPPAEAIAIARQIADALEVAHEKGIVHRDLKPANVMITDDGKVKILDFGLARTNDSSGRDSDLSHSPTIARLATQAGVILGTAAYMSPEQARGKRVDKRSDIWSFGVILWEMLTGERLFRGETVSDTLASVLTREPDYSKLPAATPPNIVWVLRRSLERDPKRRLRDAGDVALCLDDAEPGGATPAARSRKRSLVAGAALAVLLLALALGGAVLASRHSELPQPLHVSIFPPQGTRLALSGIQPGPPIVSPDGRFVLLTLDTAGGKRRLWLRDLVTGEGRWIEGTDGASYPFWSFDSKQIGFFADTQMKRIPISGGPPIALAHAPNAKGGAWSPQNVILYAPAFNSPIYRVPAEGGTPVQVTTVGVAGGDSGHRFPQFLDGGKRFMYLQKKRGETGHRMVVRPLDEASETTILEVDQNAFAAGGHLFFRRDRTLMAQPFDSKRGVLEGSAIPVAVHVKTIPGANRLIADASERVIILQRGELRNLAQLAWVDRSGNVIEKIGEPLEFTNVTLSPDGSRIAARIDLDIWIIDVPSGNRERVTFDSSIRSAAIWSPDGKRIAYTWSAGGPLEIHVSALPADGASRAVVKMSFPNALLRPSHWSPDGTAILYEEEDTIGNSTKVMLVRLDDGSTTTVNEGTVRFPNPRFSPDGRWISYSNSDGQGTPTVYVVTYPQLHRRWQIGQGEAGSWRSDGQEFFFEDMDGWVQAVPLRVLGENFAWGQSARLFQVSDHAMTGDGTRFLITQNLDDGKNEPVELIVNWRAMVAPARR